MSRYIIKPVRDRDFYINWSSITGRTVGYGTRAELEAEDSEVFSAERFERADEKGTSSFIGEDSWYNSADYVVLGGSLFIQRDLMEEWVKTLDSNGKDTTESNNYLEQFN
jgi:hypothetical protein